MARNPKPLTDAQREEMKTVWRATHNRTRRTKYAKDPAYKETVNAQGRSSYRKTKGVELRETARENTGREEEFGRERRVLVNGAEQCLHTFSVREMAELIGRHHIVIHKWLKDRKFPRPNVLRAAFSEGQAGAYVYSLVQTRRLLAIMAKHQAEKIYLDHSDEETIAELFAAVDDE